MNTHRHPEASGKLSRGFTLIELLTVIAIIGILAAIIIPTVGKVRTTAKRAQGLSNLRQVNLAGIAYINENKGRWYHDTNNQYQGQGQGQGSPYYYPKYLTRYITSQAVTDKPFGDYFFDPMVPVQGNNALHFGVLRLLFSEVTTKYNNLLRIKNPAGQVFFADTYVNETGGSGSTVQNTGVDAWSAANVASDANATSVPPANFTQDVRYLDLTRDKGQTKLGFLDGHVAIVKREALFQRLFNPLFNM